MLEGEFQTLRAFIRKKKKREKNHTKNAYHMILQMR